MDIKLIHIIILMTNIFKDGDFKNHILNEENIYITEDYINYIFKTYNFDYKVKNLEMFQLAMTHISYLDKKMVKDEKTIKLLKDVDPIAADKKHLAMPLRIGYYGRLEHLGDSVIHIVITQYLYKRYPMKNEGFLTKLRTKIEKAETLSFLSKLIGLQKYAVIARNIEQKNGRLTDVHLTEDIFESFVGALSLEATFEEYSEFLISLIQKELNFSELINYDDNYKEQLMQHFHKKRWNEPKYIKEKKITNCHSQEIYIIVKDNCEKIIGNGMGNTKIKAEQDAAKNALENLGVLHNNSDTGSDYYGEDDKLDNDNDNNNDNNNDNEESYFYE